MKNAIALLITLLFIMLITISISIGLKQLNQASSDVDGEKFMYQSAIILEDTLNILKTLKELEDINSSLGLKDFLSNNSFIPFESNGVKVSIKISSARSKFNVNSLVVESKQDEKKIESLSKYLNSYMVTNEYINILTSSMGVDEDDISYNNDLFYKRPNLFREYITSKKHLFELNSYYSNYYHDNNLKNINFEKLFSYSKNKSYKIDLNFATPEVWEMILGCSKQKAVSLSSDIYENKDDIDLNEEEKELLNRFESDIFVGSLDISLNIIQDKKSATIRFEYDIENKEGSDFVYEI